MQTANGLPPANSHASRLVVHPFDPLSTRCRRHEWIRKVLCFPHNLVVPELHDAHGVGRLAVIGQDKFGDAKIAAANDSSDRKPFFVGLTSALALYVASAASSFAGLRVFQHRAVLIDAVLRFKIVGIGRRPMLIQRRADRLISQSRILLADSLIVHLGPFRYPGSKMFPWNRNLPLVTSRFLFGHCLSDIANLARY
jgi:hypothetical protein